MSDTPPSPNRDESAHVIVQNHEARLAKLEEGGRKDFVKIMTANASTSALLLGLVLSLVSLYDAFVTKPEADRISRISQFNEAVNSAAKLRQDVIQFQMQTSDPKLQLAEMSAVSPQIMNDVSTAKVILRDLSNKDVGIPQLIVLIYESLSSSDFDSAEQFVGRAVSKEDVTPFLRSEAKRYEGKYFFQRGQPVQARQSFEDALNAVGNGQGVTATRAYILYDLVSMEFFAGDCNTAIGDLRTFEDTLNSPILPLSARSQMGMSLAAQLRQSPGQHCTAPEEILKALSGT